nr:thrombospondin type-1 domain-containing protein 7A-like [Procambarus clarkii]
MPCPPPDELTQVETCRVEPCGGASWVAGPWGGCALPAGAACGPGRQTRPLQCRDHNNNTLSTYRCSGLSRPDLERPCEVSCGTACTVTSWSEWSPCLAPDPCPIDGVLVSSVQRRWRRVLVQPSEGGKACPSLEEERGCAHAPVACTTHHWRAGPWTRCTLADDVECGPGYRVRRVECVDAAGEVAEPTHCLLGDHIVPESSVECQVSCKEACVISSWSAWTVCPTHPPCGHSSIRTRQLLDGSESNPECEDVSLMESQECPCHNFYSTPTGSWSVCVVGVEQHGGVAVAPVQELGVCGVGRRYRALLCTRDDGVLAHPRSCGHSGEEEEPCMVECPSECGVGPWTPWAACNASCGSTLQHRTRQIEEPSLWGGRPCPETSQSRACWGPCSAVWVPGGWSECHITNNTDCGKGIQTRSVRCMAEAATGLQQQVPEDHCDSWLQPPTHQTCHISCPGDCVLSSWSPWSPCPQGCPEGSRRSRSREVVRRPVGSLVTCPPLTEQEACIKGASCWSYTWLVGDWTSCVPLGHSSCGEGVRNRPVTCVRSGGLPVPEWMCPRGTRPSPKETWCYVDCPIDCEVTPWTPWDDSKCSCGENRK